MNAKIDAPTPQRINVPEGTVNLPGPFDFSMVPIERNGK